MAVVDLFFAEHEIVGAEHIPHDRPVLLVANHHSALMDALLLYAASPRDLQAIGKSTLWKILPLRPFLKAADVIPIYRTQDGGGDNSSSFSAVTDALCDGAAIAIFAEGKSHESPGLEPIKTGAARMALDAVAAGAEPVVVPVGLIFEDRERFRSDVLIRIGAPYDISAAHPGASSADRDQVRSLTEQIETLLRVEAPAWESVEERRAARTAAMHALPPGSSLSEIETAAEDFQRSGKLPAADASVVGERGEVELLVKPPDFYDGLAAGILTPLAIAGLLFNGLPYMTIGAIAARNSSDMQATVKAAGALVLYPLWWLTIAVVIGLLSGSLVAAAAVAGVVALLGLIAARELPLAKDERRTLAAISRRHATERLE